jgi:eukaryotic-like serine/threonine-protein kinase
MTAPFDFQKGQVLDGRFQISDEIGAGGSAVIYRAQDLTTGGVVAVKVLAPDAARNSARASNYRRRFEREVDVVQRLDHESIVRFVAAGVIDNATFYAALEFVEGATLSAILEQEQALTPMEAHSFGLQLFDALRGAHSVGVVHRDIKPDNIMVRPGTGYRSLSVLDFGIAGLLEGYRDLDYISLTKTGEVHGTLAYMAPEQLMGDGLTTQSDVYAAGLVIFECLTGTNPYRGGSLPSIINQQLGPHNVGLPPWLERHALGEFVVRATAKSLSQRLASAGEALDLLRGIDASTLDSPFADPGVVMATTAEVHPPTMPMNRRPGECISCRQINPWGFKFCGACGTPLPQE